MKTFVKGNRPTASLCAAIVATTLIGCTSLQAHDEPFVKADVREVIRNAIVTTSIQPDGRVILLTPAGEVLDASRLPKLHLPSKIGGGTNTSVTSISQFAIEGSPQEIRANYGFGVVCFVIDKELGKYLGGCPKEQYE